MGCSSGPDIIQDGLTFCVDAASVRSYPGTGTNWTDFVSGSNAVLTNGPLFESDNGGRITFDGANDSVVCPINIGNSQGTVMCWVYPTSTSDNFFTYTNNAPTSNYSHMLGISSLNKLHVYIYHNTILQFDGPDDMSLNVWHHVVFSWIDNDRITTYLNGKLQDYRNLNSSWKGGSNVWLGVNGGGGNTVRDWFNGSMSIFSTYNRALSADEIRQNYLSTKERFA